MIAHPIPAHPLPTIHRNGTSAQCLLDGYREAAGAVRDALAVFERVEFNARDYYPQGPDAYKQAREARECIGQMLRAAEDYCMAHAIHASDNLTEARP